MDCFKMSENKFKSHNWQKPLFSVAFVYIRNDESIIYTLMTTNNSNDRNNTVVKNLNYRHKPFIFLIQNVVLVGIFFFFIYITNFVFIFWMKRVPISVIFMWYIKHDNVNIQFRLMEMNTCINRACVCSLKHKTFGWFYTQFS